MARVREGLAKQKREHEARHGWLETWFNSSPWSTTLISTLLGPLVILLLLLTFGPCILDRLVKLMKDRLVTIQLMVQRLQIYSPLRTEDT